MRTRAPTQRKYLSRYLERAARAHYTSATTVHHRGLSPPSYRAADIRADSMSTAQSVAVAPLPPRALCIFAYSHTRSCQPFEAVDGVSPRLPQTTSLCHIAVHHSLSAIPPPSHTSLFPSLILSLSPTGHNYWRSSPYQHNYSHSSPYQVPIAAS